MAQPLTEPIPTSDGHPPALPAEVQLYREDLTQAAFTPRQLRAVRETFGRAYAQVMADQESDDRFLVMAWLKLQADHGPFPLELLDDVVIRVKVGADGQPESAPGEADPFDGASSRP